MAWNGDPRSIPKELLNSKIEEEFRKNVSDFLMIRNGATTPDQGWPWPWKDSRTTDFTYSFYNKKVYSSYFGKIWFDPLSNSIDDEEEPKDKESTDNLGTPVFPDMTNIQNVDLDRRSGLVIVRIL